jgi:hypothetical protein
MRIKVLITCLCYFFNIVSYKVIGHKELDDLKAYMIETMCMLELCFPPFFDMQEHLMIHLIGSDPHIRLAILTQYISV